MEPMEGKTDKESILVSMFTSYPVTVTHWIQVMITNNYPRWRCVISECTIVATFNFLCWQLILVNIVILKYMSFFKNTK